VGRVNAAIVLHPGRERSVVRGHPWVFSGAIRRVEGAPDSGDTVAVRDAAGSLLGHAAYSPASQIRARMWTWADRRGGEPGEAVTAELITARIHSHSRPLPPRGVAARSSSSRWGGDTTDGVWGPREAGRLVFSEASGVPGLIADRYGSVVVCQLTSAGAERWRDVIADALFTVPGVTSVYERSDVDVRQREGLQPRTGLMRGFEPPDEVVIEENGALFAVDVRHGHKTGFYLDQRNARAAMAKWATGRRVLNVFSYTGSFSVIAALHGAASVTSIDSSATALAAATRNAELNGVDIGRLIEADAFGELRRLRDRAAQFDLIVLDPPKLANNERQLDKASRAYKDLNLLALKLLAPEGVLVTFSCSGAMTIDLFQKVVAGAALDARRNAQIIDRLHQPADHPVPLHFPEAEYLKGLVMRVA
jgi:23S rRNA (cytosine1962-C5)-methyltransferase